MNDDITIPKINSQRARSMARVTGALLRLLGEKPYGRITVTELCSAAGVGRKTFYRSFSDKDAVVESILDAMFVSLAQRYDFFESGSLSMLAYCYEYLAAHREMSGLFLDVTLYDLLVKKVRFFVETAYDSTLHRASSFEPTLADYYYTFIAVGIVSLIHNWVASGYKLPVKTLATMTVRLLSGVLK